MHRATPDQPDEDASMFRAISEAGDPHVEPRPEHVASLRSLLMERIDAIHSRPARRWKLRLLVGSGLAAAALALLSFFRPEAAWAQVAEALRGRPWVHGKVVGPDGKELVEQWLSSARDLGGERAGPQVAFHNYKRKTLTKYVAAEGVIYRLPEPPEGTPGEANFLRQLLDLLLDPAGPPRFPFPGLELIGQARREVEDGGKERLEIELTLRPAGGSRGPDLAMRVRVDPASNLPESLIFDAEGGRRYVASIDYPDRGPADIYDLGVPRTARVVDRTPPDAVGDVLEGLKAGRRRFDDYCGFVVEERLLPIYYFPRVTAYRVWRKGPKWRVERLRPGQEGWAPPPGADVAWWKEHQGGFTFVPELVCDGKAYWQYSLGDAWKPGMPMPGEADLPVGRTIGPNPLMGPADDPVLPSWCQDLLPEQAGHPTAGVGEPDHDREFLVESRPGSGPPGTILLRGRDTSPHAAGAPDHFRFWVDVRENHLAMRAEVRVSDAADLSKVAFIDTHVIEAVAKSPKGDSYPTRTRQIYRNGEHELARRFSLDFEAQVPDDLFRPLE